MEENKVAELLKDKGPGFIDDALELLDGLHEMVCERNEHRCKRCSARLNTEYGCVACPFDTVRTCFVCHFYE